MSTREIRMIRGTESMDQPVEKGRRGRRFWGLVLGAVVAITLVAVLVAPAVSRWLRADRSVDLARLRLATVERGDVERDVSLQGQVVAAYHPRLFSPAEGIVSLSVRAGQEVTADQVLATLESPELLSELARERSALESLESEAGRQTIAARQQNLTNAQETDLLRVRRSAAGRELERQERLRADGLTNQVDVERAKDEVALAELELRHAEEKARLEAEALDFELSDRRSRVERQREIVRDLERRVDRLEVRAPFDGMVASIDVDDRDAVAANQALLTIVDLSEFEVEIQVPEIYADDLVAGTPAVVVYDGREYEAAVTTVSPEVTASQVEALVAFAGEGPEGLRQSQRLTTRLVFERRQGVLKLPRGPYLDSGAGRKIYVLEDGLASLRDIRVGATSVTEVEILEGLAEGERVLLTNVNQFDGAETVLVRR